MRAPAKEPALTPEQAKLIAGVNLIESDLAGNDIPHDAEGNPVEPEVPVDKVGTNADMLGFLVTMATPAMPFLPECYTPEVIGKIAGAFTAVEEKYGWDVGSKFSGPELALAVFAIPPTITAYQLGKAHFAEKRAEREAAEKAKAQGSAGTGLERATAGAIGD